MYAGVNRVVQVVDVLYLTGIIRLVLQQLLVVTKATFLALLDKEFQTGFDVVYVILALQSLPSNCFGKAPLLVGLSDEAPGRTDLAEQ